MGGTSSVRPIGMPSAAPTGSATVQRCGGDAASAAPGHEQGRLLEPATRAQLEPRFNFDFSKVRVHDDSQAHRSAARAQCARIYRR